MVLDRDPTLLGERLDTCRPYRRRRLAQYLDAEHHVELGEYSGRSGLPSQGRERLLPALGHYVGGSQEISRRSKAPTLDQEGNAASAASAARVTSSGVPAATRA